MGTKGAFSLIELLIAITVLAILATGLATLAVGLVDGSRARRTESEIGSIRLALGQYRNVFGQHPPVHGGAGFPAGGPPSTVPIVASEADLAAGSFAGYEALSASGDSDADRRARNRALRIYLELPWPGVREAPFLDASTGVGRGGAPIDGLALYVDAWGSPLVFDSPGFDHAHDLDVGGHPIPGRIDTGRSAGPYVAGEERRWSIDIHSPGPDRVTDSGVHDGATADTHRDDIVGWGPQVAR